MLSLEELQADLEASRAVVRDLSADLDKFMTEFSSIDKEDVDKVNVYHSKIGEYSVRISAERTKCTELEKEIEEHVKDVPCPEPDIKPAHVQYSYQNEVKRGHTSDFFDTMQSHVSSGNTSYNGGKPPKLRAGGDLCIFLDRFEHHYVLSGESHVSSLDLRLLNLIEDDNLYRKFRSILRSIEPASKRSVTLFTAAIKSVLYPETESRTLRDTLYTMKQDVNESVEDFSLRIESEAAKAFSSLEQSLRNEACLSALSNGISSVHIRRKLKEAEIRSFEAATRLAIKHEHILESTKYHVENSLESELQPFNVLSLENSSFATVPSQSSNVARTQLQNRSNPVVCFNCNKPGHIRRFCTSTSTQFENTRGYQPSKYCHICNRTNHSTNQCFYNSKNRNDSNKVPVNQRRSLNTKTTGEFTVHPSRRQ